MPMTIPVLMPVPRCRCRDFQMALILVTNIARFGIFTEKTLVSKKFVLKTLVNVVLKKLDAKHIVTDNFNL